jgi:ATP-dependent exoDNAse (exonuclease V) beta subunit
MHFHSRQSSAMRIMTVHKSKGLDFRVVDYAILRLGHG